MKRDELLNALLSDPTVIADMFALLRSETSDKSAKTISEMFDDYLNDKSEVLSPLTVRYYRIIQKNRFQSIMTRCPQNMAKSDWQRAVNDESKLYAPKTVKESFNGIKTVVLNQADIHVPTVTLPGKIVNQKKFLNPIEIPKFVAEVAPTKYAVPLLLALSSLRISEIDALDWEDIPFDPEFIYVQSTCVLNEENKYVKKRQCKNETSARPVPILIPELKIALERDRRSYGRVMPCSQNNLRLACHRLSKRAGVTEVGVHELRHSFASLCYHLRVPEEIAAQIGGWADVNTMRKIYTHIAQTDITRYQNELLDFYTSSASRGTKK